MALVRARAPASETSFSIRRGKLDIWCSAACAQDERFDGGDCAKSTVMVENKNGNY
jgi:hypothetical protein